MSAQTNKSVGPGEDAPQLYVGVGGTGSKVLQQISRLLARKMANARGWGNEELADRLKGFARFVVIDTDSKDLGGRQAGAGEQGLQFDAVVPISNFDKGAYVAHARGDSFHAADPHLTQWLYDDYEPRGAGGAGAGQIRIESRLCAYHAIAEGRLGAELRTAAAALRDIMKTGRQNDAAIDVHLVFSVSGGTGAGSFLPLAYYLRNVVFENVKTRIFGYALMPHAFSESVGVNFHHVCANAYAALKELDYFNRIGVKVSPESLYAPKSIELHYDLPNRAAGKRVLERPFEATYVIDRPLDFTLPQEMLLKAVGDWIFTRLYTPLGAQMESDLDNFTKHQTTLYPVNARDALGKGFSNMYATAGCCVLNVPYGDLLEYCSHRFAVDALRAFLLLSDPEILPAQKDGGGDLREQFRRFAVAEDPKRDPKETARLLDQSFVGKMRYLVKAFEKSPGSYWSRFATLEKSVVERFNAKFDAEVDSLMGGALSGGFPRLSEQTVDSPTWTATSYVDRLNAATEGAKRNADRAVTQASAETLGQEWWLGFLASAGVDGKPLSPYEQRFALISLLGQTEEDAPLSTKNRNELEVSAQKAGASLATAAADACKAALDKQVEALAATKTTGLWDRMVREKAAKEEFRNIQRDIVKTTSERVRSVESALRAKVRQRVADELFKTGDRMLALFRAVDQQAPQLAESLESMTDKFRASPSSVTLSQAAHRSDADLYTIDEEALMFTTGEKSRVWDWYYEDQVRPLLTGEQALQALTSAIQDELAPKYDAQGRLVERQTNEVVNAIVKALATRARESLTTQGAPLYYEDLDLERFLLLEAVYNYVATTFEYREAKGAKDKLALFRAKYESALGGVSSIVPARLHPTGELWGKLQGYVTAKVNEAVEKAGKLSFYRESDLTAAETHAVTTLAGTHERYANRESVICQALEAAHVRVKGDIGWYDPARIFLFTYTTGVPLYAFPRVRQELQADYREHQAQTHKPWYLHIDKNFEGLPDLDPDDLKAEAIAGLERKRTEERDRELRMITALFAQDLLGLGVTKGGAVPPGAITLKQPDGKRTKLGDALNEAVLRAAHEDSALKPLVERFLDPARKQLEPLLDGEQISEELLAKVSAFDAKLLDLEVKISNGELKVDSGVSQSIATLRKHAGELKRYEPLAGPIGVEI